MQIEMQIEKENDIQLERNMSQTQNTTQKSKNRKPLTIAEKRELRTNYRELAEETEAEIMSGSANILVQQIRKGNTLFKTVDSTQEAVLDAEFLLKAADIAKEKARQLKVGGTNFDFSEYMSKILWKKNREGWSGIRTLAKDTCTLTPSIGFMLGAVKVDLKDKKARKVAAKLDRNTRNVKRPEMLKDDQQEVDHNETSHNVQSIYKILESLCENGPINFYTFIVNPFSFSQTVENLFYLSFLIRDGIVYISENEDGSGDLVVETCEAPTPEQLQDRDNLLVKIQNILHFDVASWKKVIEDHSITECLIPNRDPVPDANAVSWQ